jgi:hypothetical protein
MGGGLSAGSSGMRQQRTPLGAQLQSLLAGAASAGPPSALLAAAGGAAAPWKVAAEPFAAAHAQALPPVPPLDLRGSASLGGASSGSRASALTEEALLRAGSSLLAPMPSSGMSSRGSGTVAEPPGSDADATPRAHAPPPPPPTRLLDRAQSAPAGHVPLPLRPPPDCTASFARLAASRQLPAKRQLLSPPLQQPPGEADRGEGAAAALPLAPQGSESLPPSANPGSFQGGVWLSRPVHACMLCWSYS